MPSSIWDQARSLPDSQQGQPTQQPVAAQAAQNSQPTIWDRARGLSVQNSKAPGLMDDVKDSANFLGNEAMGLVKAPWKMLNDAYLGAADWHKSHPVLDALLPGSSVYGPTLNGIAGGSLQNLDKLKQDINSGDIQSGVAHSIGSVPLLSPVGSLYDKYQSGDSKGLAEDIGDIAGNILMGKAVHGAVSTTGKVASKASGVISNFTKVDPAIAAIRAWSPTPTEYGFEQRLPETLAKIQDAYGQPVKTNVQAIEATQKAMDNHKQAYQAWLGRGRATGATAPGDAIVEATRKAIPETMWQEDPAMAQAIVDKTQRAYGGKNLTTDQLETFRKEKTADLKSFYDKNTGNQIASVVGGSPEAVIKAQRDTIADSLYKALDPQGQGAAPRQIQLDRSDMIDVKNAAMRRSNVAIGSKPVSKASAVISAVPKAIQSMVSHPGIGYVKAADISNPATLFAGAVDPWVAKAFGAVSKTKVTRPVMPPLLPMPAQNP